MMKMYLEALFSIIFAQCLIFERAIHSTCSLNVDSISKTFKLRWINLLNDALTFKNLWNINHKWPFRFVSWSVNVLYVKCTKFYHKFRFWRNFLWWIIVVSFLDLDRSFLIFWLIKHSNKLSHSFYIQFFQVHVCISIKYFGASVLHTTWRSAIGATCLI